jgi:hypothetical protein
MNVIFLTLESLQGWKCYIFTINDWWIRSTIFPLYVVYFLLSCMFYLSLPRYTYLDFCIWTALHHDAISDPISSLQLALQISSGVAVISWDFTAVGCGCVILNPFVDWGFRLNPAGLLQLEQTSKSFKLFPFKTFSSVYRILKWEKAWLYFCTCLAPLPSQRSSWSVE